MKRSVYDLYIDGNEITDCAIAPNIGVVFVLKAYQKMEDDGVGGEEDSMPQYRKTILLYYSPTLLVDSDGFSASTWKQGVDIFHITYNERVIATTSEDFEIYESKRDIGLHTPIPDDFYMRYGTSIATINGTTYIGGLFHKVFRRDGFKNWIDITSEKEHPCLFMDLRRRKEKLNSLKRVNASFKTLSGFSNDDIYAGGDSGDFWHYNGIRWQMIDLPGSLDIKSITCAEDGFVYVAGHNSLGIIKGRNHSWEYVAKTQLNINDTTWFQGKLYLSDDYALYFIKKDELVVYKFPESGPQQHSFAKITSNEELLVSYGRSQALLFDGARWEEVIGVVH